MLSGVKFLLDFLWFTLHCTLRWAIIILIDENATQKIKQKKNYLRLGFLIWKSPLYAGQICPPYLAVTTDNWKIRRQCPTWPTYFVHTAQTDAHDAL